MNRWYHEYIIIILYVILTANMKNETNPHVDPLIMLIVDGEK